MSSTAIAKPSQSIERMRSELAAIPTRTEIAETIGVIVAGCARSAELDETEAKIRMRLIADLLAHYPRSVVLRARDPYFGIVGRHTFLPAVHEVKQFCEDIIAEHLNELRRAEQEREREEDARREQAWREAQPPAEERASKAAAVIARCGFAKRMPSPLPRATPEEIREWNSSSCESPPNDPPAR